MTWANMERPNVALMIVSGCLSNPAKDAIARFEERNNPAFRIKYWEAKHIETLLKKAPFVATQYHLRSTSTVKRPRETIAQFKERTLPGRKFWYKYTTDEGAEIKIQAYNYVANAGELQLDDSLPKPQIKFRPRHFVLRSVTPEQDGSCITMKMPIPNKQTSKFELEQRLTVAGIQMEIVTYQGESESFGTNIASKLL